MAAERPRRSAACGADGARCCDCKGFSSASAPQIIYPLDEDYNGNGSIESWEDIPPYGTPNPVLTNPEWAPHYFCEDTGLIDGGPTDNGTAGSVPAPNVDLCTGYNNNQLCDDGGPGSTSDACTFGTDLTDCGMRYHEDSRASCPAKSRVVYFLLRRSVLSQADIAGLSCQTSGSCWNKLLSLEQQGAAVLDPVWICQNRNYSYCSNNRLDLRDGKVFFAPAEDAVSFTPLLAEIEEAFRYKTRFVSRTGKTLGFTPQLCNPISDSVPYCYAPERIEQIQQRIDCLLDIHRNHYGALNTAVVRPLLDTTLGMIFARDDAAGRDGFERLNAELLVMLGDDAFTRASAARFDLAATSQAAFQGSLFEPGGIDLSGGAGFEMANLYQAVQYYDLALGRFYALSPAMWGAISFGAATRNFVSQATVTTYLPRVANASTRKAQAWAQIAKRYQSFNRPELARWVIERAYAGTYLESVLLARMIWELRDGAAPEVVPQIDKTLEEIQIRYRVALSRMRDTYSDITDEMNHFGFPPDYVPFPPLPNSAGGDATAFSLVLESAWSKVQLAATREQRALADSRDFDTDAELFQTELASIENTYYGELGTLCGTFVGRDGNVYPAIAALAHMNDRASEFGNPCGLLGNGTLHEARVGIELAALDVDRVIQQQENLRLSIENERRRVASFCAVNEALVDYTYQQAGAIIGLKTTIDAIQLTIDGARAAFDMAAQFLSISKCKPPTVGTANSVGDCPHSAIASGTLASLGAPLLVTEAVADAAIASMQAGVAQIERGTARYKGLADCDFARIDSEAKMFDMLLEYNLLGVDLLKAEYNLRLAMSGAGRLHNEQINLMANWQEAQQLLINAEAARNDPNVRIYRNDAIINAERAFETAIAEVYRATRIFEYFASQSYAKKEELFLARMVEVGDVNLVHYLVELETAYDEFRELFGNPDTRVAVLSLRDDILNIPRVNSDMGAISRAERITQLRGELTSGTHVDDNGYLAFAFSTSLERLSPLTRNHKILFIEAELVGEGIGDDLARIYVQQHGTSTVQGVAGDKSFFQFPPRTAVLNPFFNGDRSSFATDIHRNYRLRDRPYVNSGWTLIFNQVDEHENLDVNLNGIDDIRLYVYYTDLTEL